MPTEIMIRTHDGHQTQLPLELVRFSDFMTNYVKDYPEGIKLIIYKIFIN